MSTPRSIAWLPNRNTTSKSSRTPPSSQLVSSLNTRRRGLDRTSARWPATVARRTVDQPEAVQHHQRAVHVHRVRGSATSAIRVWRRCRVSTPSTGRTVRCAPARPAPAGSGAPVEFVQERQVLEVVRVQPAGDEQSLGSSKLSKISICRSMSRPATARGRSPGSPRAARALHRPAAAVCPWCRPSGPAAHRPKTTELSAKRKRSRSPIVSDCYGV